MNIINQNEDYKLKLINELVNGYLNSDNALIILRDQAHLDIFRNNLLSLINTTSIYDINEYNQSININKIKEIIKTLVASHDFPVTTEQEMQELKIIYQVLFPSE